MHYGYYVAQHNKGDIGQLRRFPSAQQDQAEGRQIRKKVTKYENKNEISRVETK